MGVDTNCSKSNPEWLWINLRAFDMFPAAARISVLATVTEACAGRMRVTAMVPLFD
jgi:hypothetical protein